MALSDSQMELIDSFSEVRAIGLEIAEKINSWNESNLDIDKSFGVITQDMSGDSIVLNYTEHGFDEEDVYNMLKGIGFSIQEDSDDAVEVDVKKPKDINERLNEFLLRCSEVSNTYPYFVKEIELLPGNHARKDEVRIVISSEIDFRKLPSQNARKILFMHFLKDIREVSSHFSMLDEAMCFCNSKNEFWIVLKPLSIASD